MTKPEILLISKSVLRSPSGVPRSNHAGHIVATADLLDQSFVTIPGITVQLEVKSPVAVDSCLYLFSIMQLQAKKRTCLFQLEVAPHGPVA